jgi:imidazole glycerol-phosphate synthase subunit HisH
VNPRIALIDYGAGNLASVRKGLLAAGGDIFTPETPDDLRRAAGVVVPGVGHFSATASLSGLWRERILERTAAGVPLFGICLGMQWLFDGSAEAPDVTGLGLMAGTCARLEAASPLKVPHVGWNSLSPSQPAPLLRGVTTGAYVYFTHSYAAPVTAECVATASHGVRFAAAVQRDHIAGVQFHPEKSSETGLAILRNFVALVRR